MEFVRQACANVAGDIATGTAKIDVLSPITLLLRFGESVPNIRRNLYHQHSNVETSFIQCTHLLTGTTATPHTLWHTPLVNVSIPLPRPRGRLRPRWRP